MGVIVGVVVRAGGHVGVGGLNVGVVVLNVGVARLGVEVGEGGHCGRLLLLLLRVVVGRLGRRGRSGVGGGVRDGRHGVGGRRGRGGQGGVVVIPVRGREGRRKHEVAWKTQHDLDAVEGSPSSSAAARGSAREACRRRYAPASARGHASAAASGSCASDDASEAPARCRRPSEGLANDADGSCDGSRTGGAAGGGGLPVHASFPPSGIQASLRRGRPYRALFHELLWALTAARTSTLVSTDCLSFSGSDFSVFDFFFLGFSL